MNKLTARQCRRCRKRLRRKIVRKRRLLLPVLWEADVSLLCPFYESCRFCSCAILNNIVFWLK